MHRMPPARRGSRLLWSSLRGGVRGARTGLREWRADALHRLGRVCSGLAVRLHNEDRLPIAALAPGSVHSLRPSGARFPARICKERGVSAHTHRRMRLMLGPSSVGNIAILSAILGSVIKAIDVLSQPSLGPHGASLNATSPEVEPVVWPNNPMKVPVFLGAVFYAFEGIALVLPIENSLSVRAAKASSCFGYEELVVTAMSTVVLIFAIIGTVCGRAFPHASGSVVAYLAMEYPHSPTLQVLNGAVAAAVLCSFPLQLAPAMPAIEQACCSHVGFESYRWWHTYLIRTFIVFGCACIILVLPDVQMLVALTGALTTTTITAFPFIMQLKLAASRAIAPLRCGSLFLAIWVIIFSFFVMCLGTFTALRDIIESFK
mmetsp:Transcript_3849/g.11890  ORF Transcript_3849/g.11890 Transcript_3849/m.11890 type:complete len:375 (-) Transcript_3849:735-1859(-)